MTMDYSVILVPLLTLLFAQAFILDLARFRFPRGKLFLIIVSQMMVVVLISSLVLLFGGLSMYARWYVPIMVIPAYATFLFTSKHRDARDLFTIVTIIFLSFIISIPAMWFAQFYHTGYGFYNLVRLVLFAVVFLSIHLGFRKYYLIAQDEIDKGWAIFSILPLLGSVVLYVGFIQYGQTGSFTNVLFLTTITVVMMASVYGVIFYVFQQLHEKYVVLEQKRTLTMQNMAQLEQHMLFRDAAEKTNRRWHDLRHTTQSIIELLESGDTNTALGYLKDQMGMIGITKVEYCQHAAVNSILCLWAERSRVEGIVLSVEVSIPEKLEIEPVELSSLFANAIENAYFACMELPKEIARYISVEAHYNGKRLAIGITNTCKEDVGFEGGLPISLKEGGGIGTRSMVYTVKRFYGAYTFSAKDGLFFSRFVLNV